MSILIFSEHGKYTTKLTLEEARTSADCANKTVVVTSVLSEAQSNIIGEWPADRALRVEKGGSINPTTAFTGLTYAELEWFGINSIQGTTDMTTAFKRAIASVAGGGFLKLPTGKIKLTDEITMKSGVTIEGVSNVDLYYPLSAKTGDENPTFIFQATANKAIFVYGEGVQDTTISKLCLSAVETPTQLATSPVVGKYGIKATGARPNSSWRQRFDQVTFYNFERAISVVGTDGGSGIDWQFDDVQVSQCTFFNNTAGVYFNTTNADYWKFDTCGFLVPDNGDAIYVERAGFFTVVNSTAGPIVFPGATNADFLHIGDYSDSITLDNVQTEGLTNFVHIDTSSDYLNSYYPLTIIGCLVESPILIERQYLINSFSSRYTSDVTISGNSVIYNSTSDSWGTSEMLITGSSVIHNQWPYSTDWSAPTLLNSWVNVGTPYEVAGYLKDSAGVIHVRGALSGGLTNTIVFQLPVGYRPSSVFYLPIVGAAGSITYLSVDVSGNVTVQGTVTAFCDVKFSFYP